ncbi:MAG: hypothetical protein LBL13_01795, partial [Bacteroidales bacterium]|nr:hypothetical protein [Bacteroidales bacterium]
MGEKEEGNKQQAASNRQASHEEQVARKYLLFVSFVLSCLLPFRWFVIASAAKQSSIPFRISYHPLSLYTLLCFI